MSPWIAIIIGLAGPVPTFHGEYTHRMDCMAYVDHVNRAYGSMVRARCVPLHEARRRGYKNPNTAPADYKLKDAP